MNKILQTHFATIESNLQLLVDSITTYNPSIPAAQALVTADAALTSSLEDLATHQQLYNEIIQTRSRCDALEGKIKETLETLAKTREEVVAAPATKFDTSAKKTTANINGKIDFEELLAYGKRLGRFHGPAAAARQAAFEAMQAQVALATTGAPEPTAQQPSSPPQTETQRDSLRSSREPSKSVPPPPIISITADGISTRGEASVPPKTPDQETAAAGLGARNLATDETAWLNPEQSAQPVLWPHEERIRMGGLAALHAASINGQENGVQDVTMGGSTGAETMNTSTTLSGTAP